MNMFERAWNSFICANIMPSSHVHEITLERARLLWGILQGDYIDLGMVIYQRILRWPPCCHQKPLVSFGNLLMRGRLQFDNQKLNYDAVVLAVGNSARDIYQILLTNEVDLVPKDFSVGLRVEHPQELINSIQYSELSDEVRKGRGKVPVAGYKIVDYVDENNSSRAVKRSYSFCMCPGGQVVLTGTKPSELCVLFGFNPNFFAFYTLGLVW
ncbi:hypothetical protein AgCh_022964 [Apium graveolens]